MSEFSAVNAACATLNYHSRRGRNTCVKQPEHFLPPSLSLPRARPQRLVLGLLTTSHAAEATDRFSPILSKLQSRRESGVKGHYTLYTVLKYKDGLKG